MSLRYHISFLAFICLYFTDVSAQTPVMTGQLCPSFDFHQIINSQKTSLSLASLKGKLIILDFWMTSCTPCVQELPYMDSLQHEFGDQIQIIPIAMQMDDKVDALIKRLLENRMITPNVLPIIKDTIFAKYFNGRDYTLGQHTWIDDEGIIQYFSSGKSILSRENISALLHHQSTPALDSVLNDTKLQVKQTPFKPYDPNLPLFFHGNGGTMNSNLYSSILCPWNSGMYAGLGLDNISTDVPSIKLGRIEVTGLPLYRLYNIAYTDTIRPDPTPYSNDPNSYGKFWGRPILELSDSNEFSFNRQGLNLFSYSLLVPSRGISALKLQRCMQHDLDISFGYDIHLETRTMPCWNLVIDDSSKISWGDPSKTVDIQSTELDADLSNAPMKWLIYEFYGKFPFPLEPPFIDQTGIKKVINFKERDITTFEDLQKGLLKNGFKLVSASRPMKVIVIRDRPANYVISK